MRKYPLEKSYVGNEKDHNFHYGTKNVMKTLRLDTIERNHNIRLSLFWDEKKIYLKEIKINIISLSLPLLLSHSFPAKP